MYRQILVALDGSALAERALPYAAQIAVATGGTLHLVRVVEPPLTVSTPVAQGTLPTTAVERLRAAEQAEATTYLEALRARPELANLSVQTRHLSTDQIGAAAAVLLDYEGECGIELMVATTHGRTGLSRFALGSVAERLLRYGAAALLLVRAFGDAPNLAQVVVPLDGSVPAEWALRVVDELDGTVVREATLVEALAEPAERPQAEGYLALVASRLAKVGVTYRPRVEQGDPGQAILDVAGPTGLVIMATRGCSGLTRWPLGTVAERVAHSGEVSLMLVRTDWEPNNR